MAVLGLQILVDPPEGCHWCAAGLGLRVSVADRRVATLEGPHEVLPSWQLLHAQEGLQSVRQDAGAVHIPPTASQGLRDVNDKCRQRWHNVQCICSDVSQRGAGCLHAAAPARNARRRSFL